MGAAEGRGRLIYHRHYYYYYIIFYYTTEIYYKVKRNTIQSP